MMGGFRSHRRPVGCRHRAVKGDPDKQISAPTARGFSRLPSVQGQSLGLGLSAGTERWTDDFEQWPLSRHFHLAYFPLLIGQDGWNAFNFL